MLFRAMIIIVAALGLTARASSVSWWVSGEAPEPGLVYQEDGLMRIGSVALRSNEALEPGSIVTVAGTGEKGFSGDGGPGIKARFHRPVGLAVDADGNLFIADRDNHRVRKVSPEGIITTVAGTGEPGFSGDGGAATRARLNMPNFLVVDRVGNLLISDAMNGRVRKVSKAGIITTIAGSGSADDGDGSAPGDGGPAPAARLRLTHGLALDTAGNLFIADTGNHRVRKVGREGKIATVAGNGSVGSSGDGGPATGAVFQTIVGLAVGREGSLFIGDFGDHRVRRLKPDGTITTVAGTGQAGFSRDGGPAVEAQLNTPVGLAVDPSGNLFIADWGNHRVRKVDSQGIITTVAGNGSPGCSGDGGPATAAGLRGPTGLALDTSGDLFLAETGGLRDDGLGFDERVRKVLSVATPTQY